MSEQYVKINGVWFKVYKKDTWVDVLWYVLVCAAACTTVGIWLL